MLLKFVYDKLVAKVENMDTSWFVLKVQQDESNFEKKIPDTDGLNNAKMPEVEGKITIILGKIFGTDGRCL